MNMKLTITDDAMAYMKKRLAGANAYLLAANDGSNNFSEGAGGACTVGDAFQVVGVSKAPSDYDVKLENNQDADVLTSKNDMTFFGPGLKLDFKNNFLQLKDDGEMIDGQVTTNNQVDK